MVMIECSQCGVPTGLNEDFCDGCVQMMEKMDFVISERQQAAYELIQDWMNTLRKKLFVQ